LMSTVIIVPFISRFYSFISEVRGNVPRTSFPPWPSPLKGEGN
jgi:hypothetical protein